jgi:hypothetical protein
MAFLFISTLQRFVSGDKWSSFLFLWRLTSHFIPIVRPQRSYTDQQFTQMATTQMLLILPPKINFSFHSLLNWERARERERERERVSPPIGGRNSISWLEGSQASPARPSGSSSVWKKGLKLWQWQLERRAAEFNFLISNKSIIYKRNFHSHRAKMIWLARGFISKLRKHPVRTAQ